MTKPFRRTQVEKRLEAGESPFDLSIEKWERIANGIPTYLGASNCALCLHHEFICIQCPIWKVTTFPWCDKTPYERVIEHVKYCVPCTKARHVSNTEPSVLCHDGKALAKKEVRFLKRLKLKKEVTEQHGSDHQNRR